MQDNSDLIIRDCCEAEVAVFGQPDTICITVDVLREIVQRHSPGTCLHQITELQAAPAAVAVSDDPAPWCRELPEVRKGYEAFREIYRNTIAPKNSDMAWDAWQYCAALAATPAAAQEHELIDWDSAHKIAFQAAAAFRPSYFNGAGFVAHNWVVEAIRSGHIDGQRHALGLPPIDRSGAHAAKLRIERNAATPAAAAPVLLPEPEAVISEVMELVKDWAQRDLIAVEAGIDTLTEESTDKQHQEAKRLDGEAETAYRAIESKLRALLAGGSAPAALQTRTWRGGKLTVADLVNNLLMMDQALPIYGAQYIEHPPGKRRAIAVPPTVSRERIKDSRWIGEGESLNAAVIWTRAEQPIPQVTLDYPWRDRLLDGRPLERDAMGFAEHSELPLLDEGMKPRAFFAALGVEMKHTMAEDDLTIEEYDDMCNAENWSNWEPKPPSGEAWNLVAIFDTEDGPAAWWARVQKESREAPPQAQADARDAERWRAAREGVKSGDRVIHVYTAQHGLGTKLLGSAADAEIDAAIAAAKGE